MWYDTLNKLTADIVGRIAADRNFSDIPVLEYSKGDIENEVQRKLGVLKGAEGKLGACIVVKATRMKQELPNSLQPELVPRISVLIAENTDINNRTYGTGKSANSIATALVYLLALYNPQPMGTMLLPDEPFWNDEEAPGADVAVSLNYRCNLLVSGIPSRLASPTITTDQTVCPAVVTLAHANADAQLYWTYDDSYPSASNTKATLYTGPFTIHEPCFIRACAHLLGSFDSSMSYVQIT